MNNLKEINITNGMCSYFNDIIKFEDFDLDILIYEKSYRNILFYKVLCKTLIGATPLHIRFDKAEGFVRVYDGTRYFVLLSPEKYDAV